MDTLKEVKQWEDMRKKMKSSGRSIGAYEKILQYTKVQSRDNGLLYAMRIHWIIFSQQLSFTSAEVPATQLNISLTKEDIRHLEACEAWMEAMNTTTGAQGRSIGIYSKIICETEEVLKNRAIDWCSVVFPLISSSKAFMSNRLCWPRRKHWRRLIIDLSCSLLWRFEQVCRSL